MLEVILQLIGVVSLQIHIRPFRRDQNTKGHQGEKCIEII